MRRKETTKPDMIREHRVDIVFLAKEHKNRVTERRVVETVPGKVRIEKTVTVGEKMRRRSMWFDNQDAVLIMNR